MTLKDRYINLFTNFSFKKIFYLTSVVLVGIFGIEEVIAQSITPTNDGTGTRVTNQGNRFDIQGGTLSGDGENLFHSLEQFGLDANQIANFLTTPEIHNILGRITGGDPSIVNGLIQVTGGNSNLFLMNPAGFIFGSGATLNVGGDFTATTANRIGFDRGWFSTFDPNNYQTLIGNPNQFAFTLSQAGNLINAGNLSVFEGQNLTLLGGNVINTGHLSTPGGTLTLTAIPEGNVVRISQQGSLLSLEVDAAAMEARSFSPLDLAELLTGNNPNTGLTVNGDDSVTLNRSGITIPSESGTTIVSGTLDTSISNSQLPNPNSQINVFGERVGLLEGNINASGSRGGGYVRIGGDYQGKGEVPLASQTVVDGSTTIQANAIEAGDGGTIIVWSEGTTQFWGNISATGGRNSGNGGFVEVSGKQNLVFQGLVDLTSPLGNIGTLLLDPTDITISNLPNLSTIAFSGGIFTDNATSSSNLNVTTLESQLALSDVLVSTASGLSGTGNITVANMVTWNSNNSLTLDATNDILVNAPISTTGNGSISLQADRNIRVNSNITSNGGNVILNADRNRDGNGQLFNNSNDLESDLFDSGSPSGPSEAPSEGEGGGVLGEPGEPGGEGEPGEPGGEGEPGEPGGEGEPGESESEEGEEGEEGKEEDEEFNDRERFSGEALNDPEELSILEETESEFTDDFEEYFGLDEISSISTDQTKTILQNIEQLTEITPSILYITFSRPTISSEGTFEEDIPKQVTDQLELVLVTSQGKPIRQAIEGVTRLDVLRMARRFRRTVTRQQGTSYLEPAQQLYQWLIAPLEQTLTAREINNIAFVLDSGLRSLPMAALHDGEQFLVERYSLGLMPSLSLTDTSYIDLRDTQVLAMGAAIFISQNPLPAVPIELEVITDQIWNGQFFLNEDFTVEQLQKARSRQKFGIIHLATHGEFRPGNPSNSYIQFWDDKLRLDQVRELNLNNPPTELLVLSACRTALGDPEAELGFAGLAVQAGVRSALGSLWNVNDEGTLGLMTSFYERLKVESTKTEALRQAQLAMIQGKVRLENGEMITSRGNLTLPSNLVQLGDRNLTHPYYWSAFTLIGNPW